MFWWMMLALVVWALVATARAVRRDGLRRAPTARIARRPEVRR